MPKSKEMISDSESGSGSEEEVKRKSKPKKQESSDGSESEEEVKQKSKPRKAEKKKQASSESESESDGGKSKKRLKKGKEDKGPNKKAKTETRQTNSEGDEYWDLGNSKRITVRTFKGKLLIDIREYYHDKEGEMKPGKKGISLQTENWKTLLSVIDDVDKYVKSQ